MMTSDLAAQRGEMGRQRFLEAVLESAVDYAIIGLDLDGTIIEWTEGARRILGWDADEMIGRHASAFFSREDAANQVPEAEMRGARESGQASDERWHMHKDGTRFYALGEMMPLRAEDGALVGYLKILRDRTRQRLAEDALRDREAFLSSVLGSSGDCIKVLDLEGRLSFMTEIGQKVMEVADFNTLCGLSWPTFWDAAGRQDAETAVATARAGGIGRLQGFCPTMKGTPKYWDVVVTPIRGVDGTVANLLAVSRDITAILAAETARDAAETKLRFDEGLLEAILREAPIGISVTDAATGEPLILNDTIKAMLGDKPTGGAAHHAGLGAEYRDGRRYAVDDYPGVRVLKTGAPVPWEDTLVRRPGADIPRLYQASSAPVRDSDGKLIASVTIFVDIEAERAAEAEAAKLAALVEQSSDFISITGTDGRVDYINPAGLAMLGLRDLEAARSTDITSYFITQSQATIRTEAFPAVAVSGHWEGELRLGPSATGVGTPVLHTAFPLRDSAGTVIAYGGVTRDLTAQKAAQQRQTMLNHELSHRMKNMLAMVQSIAFQTLRGAPSVADARDILSARIVALSKAHDILLEDSSDTADMNAIVAAAVAPHDEIGLRRFKLAGPNVSVGPRTAMALSLMLHELATNAAKYGALSVPSGRVTITWAVEGADFSLRWSESGGPIVVQPTRLGFGSRLIERGLAADVGGKVALTYPPSGVVCTVKAALPALQAGA